MAKLFDVFERMLGEWSQKDDSLLTGDRLQHVLDKELRDDQGFTGLARQTDGYKWAHAFRKGVPNKVVRVPKGVASYCTTSGEHGLAYRTNYRIIPFLVTNVIAKLQIKTKSKSNKTKNLERLYIWVVVCSLFVVCRNAGYNRLIPF